MHITRTVLVLVGVFASGAAVTLAAALAFLVSTGSSAAAVLPAPAAPLEVNTSLAPATEGHASSAERGDGFSEGIQVHGHWAIEVREPDGSVVSRTEFENALVSSGRKRIADILARKLRPDYWEVELRHNFLDQSPCLNSSSSPTLCAIHEPQSSNPGNHVFKNLVVSVDSDGTLVLSGTANAQTDGVIGYVNTSHRGRVCNSPSEYPSNCSGSNSGTDVTQAQLPSIVSVEQGQQIAVTVEISFE